MSVSHSFFLISIVSQELSQTDAFHGAIIDEDVRQLLISHGDFLYRYTTDATTGIKRVSATATRAAPHASRSQAVISIKWNETHHDIVLKMTTDINVSEMLDVK